MFGAGCGIRLYRFLIIAFSSTLVVVLCINEKCYMYTGMIDEADSEYDPNKNERQRFAANLLKKDLGHFL